MMVRKAVAEADDKQQGLNGIERALDVLSLFSASDAPTLGVTEIASELALSKAVVHRLLTTFRARLRGNRPQNASLPARPGDRCSRLVLSGPHRLSQPRPRGPGRTRGADQ